MMSCFDSLSVLKIVFLTWLAISYLTYQIQTRFNMDSNQPYLGLIGKNSSITILKNLFARVKRKQENPSIDEPVMKIYEIRDDLTNQISLAKNMDEKINMKTISQKSHDLDKIITCQIFQMKTN